MNMFELLKKSKKKLIDFGKIGYNRSMRKRPIQEKLLFKVMSFSNYFEVYETLLNDKRSCFMAKIFQGNNKITYLADENLGQIFYEICLNLQSWSGDEEFKYSFNISKSTFRYVEYRKAFLFGYTDLKTGESVYTSFKSFKAVLTFIMKQRRGEIGIKP